MNKDMTKPPAHPWKARFFVAIIMLALTFLGVILTDIKKDGAWGYWRAITPFFVVMNIWLGWYLRRLKFQHWITSLLQEIFHWVGMLSAIYLTAFFVEMGLMGRFQASLQAVTILALTTFLAGVYIEISFIGIGISLGVLAACMAYFSAYLYGISAALFVLVGLIIYWVAKHKKKVNRQG